MAPTPDVVPKRRGRSPSNFADFVIPRTAERKASHPAITRYYSLRSPSPPIKPRWNTLKKKLETEIGHLKIAAQQRETEVDAMLTKE